MNRDLLLLAGLLIAALPIGLLAGATGWALFAAAAVFIVIQQREFQALQRWSQKPLSRPDNRRDSWQSLANTMFRSIGHSRRRAHDALRQLRAVRTANAALPDAAVVLNAAGNIEQYNEAAKSLLRLKSVDRGASLASLIRQPEFVALTRGRVEDNLIEFASPFTEGTQLEARRIAFSDRQALILVRDVTQLNRLLSMRQEFIANVSHELRTPLTVIVGYIETLVNEELDEETMHTVIGKLGSPSNRMQALVDDLLLLTRLESSPNPTNSELVAVAMPTLIDSVVADARSLSQDKHQIRVSIECDAGFLGIENEVFSACSNLVANAIRYSPDGGSIDVSWTPVAGGARFAVRDQGIGIPAEHLSRLTERFYRVDLATSRIRGGTGLGLAIVKHILKRHHSRLQVTSQLGVGSTFYFDLSQDQLTEPPPR